MNFLGPLPPLAETLRRALAEFVGAFAVIFIAAGAVLSLGPEPGAGTLEIALAYGLAMAVMIAAVGHLAGGYFNPAITLALMVTRRISILLGLVYVVAQF